MNWLRQTYMQRQVNGAGQQMKDGVGLLPKKGWRKRNIEFFQRVLIPSLLHSRSQQYHDNQKIHQWPEYHTTFLGHASFWIGIEGMQLMIDPNWALWHGPCKRLQLPILYPEQLPRMDVVLITHVHFDHLNLGSLRRLAAKQPIIVPKGVGSLVKGIGFSEVIELKWWQTCQLGHLKITLTPAKHWGARMIHDHYRGYGGYYIEGEKNNMYHAGDTAWFDGFKEIHQRCGSPQISLLPIGAYQAPSGRSVHMNPAEAVEACFELGSQVMIPMHYGTFPLGGEPWDQPLKWLNELTIKNQLQNRIKPQNQGVPFSINQ
jgi:L-ascorbate metabolism protein UlaG (beta-lactamase superfamily)